MSHFPIDAFRLAMRHGWPIERSHRDRTRTGFAQLAGETLIERISHVGVFDGKAIPLCTSLRSEANIRWVQNGMRSMGGDAA